MTPADDDDIELVDAIAAIRRRPGMYVGSTGPRGMQEVLLEVLSNSLDQVLRGRASHIKVIVHDASSVTVTDDGPGIPLDVEQDGMTFLQRVMTVVHTTPTADDHHPHIHIGVGAGLALVNALAEDLHVTVRNHEGTFSQRFSRGEAVGELERLADADATSGTEVTWRYDPEIFTEELDVEALRIRLAEIGALAEDLNLDVRFPAVSTSSTASLDVQALLPRPESLRPSPPISISYRCGDDSVDLAFR